MSNQPDKKFRVDTDGTVLERRPLDTARLYRDAEGNLCLRSQDEPTVAQEPPRKAVKNARS